MSSSPSSPLWTPNPERVANSNMMKFIEFINESEGKQFSTYAELYQWSIEEIPAFWKAVKCYFSIRFNQEEDEVMIPAKEIWQTQWFVGSTLNFAENLLLANNHDHVHNNKTAILELNELGGEREITYRELYLEVGKWSRAMRKLGIKPGDRVVGYLPNLAVTVTVMLAATSVGAVWSSCSPDFGENGVYDRFQQIEPALIITVDGYTYKGKPILTLPNLKKLVNDLTSVNYSNQKRQNLKKLVVIPYLQQNGFTVEIPNLGGEFQVSQSDFLKGENGKELDGEEIEFTPMPFSAPLYILYSSGTTGKPKCIMHGTGHTLIQHVKELGLHSNLKSEDTIFFHTTCGWMMWNWLVSSLFFKATLVLYEGSPFHPHPENLVELAKRHRFTLFGSGAGYFQALEKVWTEKVGEGASAYLPDLATVLSTGSPLCEHSYRFIYREFNSDLQLSSISGGTDIVSCFVLGSPILPVYAGEIQCRGLGMAVEVFSEGNSVVNQQGELVCTRPFPAMPIGFYNDPDDEKYRQAYFKKIAGVWCHGDYAEITSHDGVIIYGRSDTTLNPGGVRIGTAEIYKIVEAFPEVAQAAAVNWVDEEESKIVLMLKLASGDFADELDGKEILKEFFKELRQAIRTQASPRHVPSVIMVVPDIPRTVSGKISEKSITDLINGRESKNTGTLANPESLDYYRDLIIEET